MRHSQDLGNGFVMEEDAKLARLNWTGTIREACTIFFCCHGQQTQTGNHGRMGEGPKYTLVSGFQLKEHEGTAYPFLLSQLCIVKPT